MDRPFRELHELYKILFERAEAQKKAEEERAAKEAEDAKKRRNEEHERNKVFPRINPMRPSDGNQINLDNITPSPLEAEALEEAFEEMADGGIVI